MNQSDDENIYGNITNNNDLNDDSSLNELKDLAIEINDSEIKIDINDSQIPIKNDDLYQFNTTSNNETDDLYHKQLLYENTQDTNFNTPNIEEETYSNINEHIPNEIEAVDYNDITDEENVIGIQNEISDENNQIMQDDEILFEYDNNNNNEINNEISYGDYSTYAPIDEPEKPYEQEDLIEAGEESQEEEYRRNREETTYSTNYQDGYNQEYQESQNSQRKRNFMPILMVIFAVVAFFAVLNLPQVKNKISGIKSNSINDTEMKDLVDLSKTDQTILQEQNSELQNKNKRAKMVVFDEEEKTSQSANITICANPFLPTMNVDGEDGNSLGAYEIIVPPNGSEIDETVEVSTMMETKVSGILYDKENPQAILNYDGQDQLVRRGDRLAGFYVMSITPDKVILKQGNNIYRVSVGQAVTDEGINYNVNSNLGKQFGGRYKNIKGKIINMNNDQEK